MVFDTTGVFVCVDSTPRPLAAGGRLLVSPRSVEEFLSSFLDVVWIMFAHFVLHFQIPSSLATSIYFSFDGFMQYV